MKLDAATVDPKHYAIEFENQSVRVLRIRYGPREKSAMHEHPDGVGVFLSDGRAKFTYPDGKTEEISWKGGDALWFPAVTHLPENLSDSPIEVILVELKIKG